MTPSQKRERTNEEDDVMMRLPQSAPSYSNASFLKGIVGSFLLLEDECHLSAIGLTQTADWEVTRSFQVCSLTFLEFVFY